METYRGTRDICFNYKGKIDRVEDINSHVELSNGNPMVVRLYYEIEIMGIGTAAPSLYPIRIHIFTLQL